VNNLAVHLLAMPRSQGENVLGGRRTCVRSR
jgi:hypothetical protein